MSRRKRTPPEVRQGRAACAREFEPLWRPAPYLPMSRYRQMSALERADVKAAAQRTAFAWLAAKLGVAAFDSFEAIGDVELLRRAYALIAKSTINDVRRWAEAREALAA